MTVFVVFICILSLYFLHDDFSDVGLDWSDRRGSVRRASVALIWIICLVQRRRFFHSAVFPGFIHVCALWQLPALMVGGLMSTSCVSALRCGKAFMMRCCDSNPKPHALCLTPSEYIFCMFWYLNVLLRASPLPHHWRTLQGLYSVPFVCMQMVLEGSWPWKPIDPFEMGQRGRTSWWLLIHLLSEARSNSHLHVCWLRAHLYLCYVLLF